VSEHTLAVIVGALMIFHLGVALGFPKDPRPWTPLRQFSGATSLLQLVFLVWLLEGILR
jgi:hypothetical protein